MSYSTGHLEERSWNCLHDGQLETPKELHDITEQFLEVFQDREFSTFESLKVALGEFSRRTGSVYIKYSTGLFSDTVDPQEVRCKYKKIRYVCVHYGSRKSEPIRRRNQHTTKIGCGSCFSVKYKDGRLNIVSYDMKHCHPVDPESARLYPHNRRLSPSETAEIEELLDVNASINEVKRIIKERYGKVCTTRDIINMRFRRRKNLERQMGLERSEPSYSSNRYLHQEQHSAGSDFEPLAEVCCRLVLHGEEEIEEGEDKYISPVLQDAQQISGQQATTTGDGQVNASVHSMLRNLTQVWRQNRDEKEENLQYTDR
nr:Transcription factor FAR1 [Hymenolepis microstoma]